MESLNKKKQNRIIFFVQRNYKMIIICIIPIILIMITGLFYAKKFGFSFQELNTGNYDDLSSFYGQFGDYFGGVLNPLLAFINIFLIVYFQQNDNKKTSEIDNIFRMIELHNDLRNSIVITYNKKKYEGLTAFSFLDEEITTVYKNHTNGSNVLENLAKAYIYIFDDKFRKQYLSHYYRNLYQIYKMISNSTCLSKMEKLKYAKIARAQLSHLELKFLFYNCISYPGKRFKYYVGKYNLLEWFYDSEFVNMDPSLRNTKIIENEIKSWDKIQLTTAST